MLNNESNQDLKDFLKRLEGKKVLILTKFNIHYQATDLKVYQDSIFFKDKFGSEVLLAISEISQITEAQK